MASAFFALALLSVGIVSGSPSLSGRLQSLVQNLNAGAHHRQPVVVVLDRSKNELNQAKNFRNEERSDSNDGGGDSNVQNLLQLVQKSLNNNNERNERSKNDEGITNNQHNKIDSILEELEKTLENQRNGKRSTKPVARSKIAQDPPVVLVISDASDDESKLKALDSKPSKSRNIQRTSDLPSFRSHYGKAFLRMARSFECAAKKDCQNQCSSAKCNNECEENYQCGGGGGCDSDEGCGQKTGSTRGEFFITKKAGCKRC